MAEVVLVFAAALATALATGLGALPLAAPRLHGEGLLGLANAVAGGVMLGASLSLLIEGGERGVVRTALGTLAGVAVVAVTQRLLQRVEAPHLGVLRGT